MTGTPEEIERRIVELTTELYNMYQELPEDHPMEKHELCHAIHQIQALVALRAARRQMPDVYPTYNKVNSDKRVEAKQIKEQQ